MSNAPGIVPIIGNLTRDPEIRTNSSTGKDFVSFAVAVNFSKFDGTPDKKFFEVTATGKLGEGVMKTFAKGMKVFVYGELSGRGRLAEKDGAPVAYGDNVIYADDCGPSVLFQDVTVAERAPRNDSADSGSHEAPAAPAAAKGAAKRF